VESFIPDKVHTENDDITDLRTMTLMSDLSGSFDVASSWDAVGEISLDKRGRPYNRYSWKKHAGAPRMFQ